MSADEYLTARQAIIDQAQPLPRFADRVGEMPCPICARPLVYRVRANRQHHIEAHCSLPGCVAFVE